MCNLQIFDQLEDNLKHLDSEQQTDIRRPLNQYPQVMRDRREPTPWVVHDISVGPAKRIKQAPYWVNPGKTCSGR